MDKVYIVYQGNQYLQNLIIKGIYTDQDDAIEAILDNVIFMNQGKVTLNDSADNIRGETGKTIDQVFREDFRC